MKMKVKKLPKKYYHHYMGSSGWQDTKKRFAASKLPKHCYGCGAWNVPFELHHRSYRSLGRENLNHLVYVCRGCHQDIHDYHRRHPEKSLWAATNKIRRRNKATYLANAKLRAVYVQQKYGP